MRGIFSLLVGIIFSFSITEASLRVGFQERELDLPDGISLAGYIQRRVFKNGANRYARYFRSSVGKYSLPLVKSMAIDDGQKITFFVSLEIIAVEPDLKAKAEALLRQKINRPFEINLFATHTHSGPGGFVKFGLWQQLATDIYVEDVFNSFVSAIAQTSYEAYTHLEKSQLSYVKGHLNDVVYNRRNSKFLDPQVHILKFMGSDGKALATVLNFPIHGTALGPENLKISSDIPGLIEAELSNMTDSPFMFISGAAGDVGPKIDTATINSFSPLPLEKAIQINYSKMQAFSSRVVHQIFSLWKKTEFIEPKYAITKKFNIDLPVAQANLSLCLESILPKGFQWIAKIFFRINLPAELNRPMEINMIQFSPLTFYMIPGEPIGEIGAELERYSLQNNLPNPLVMTLANSYYGYILSEKEFDRGGYETCNSFYGKKYGAKFLEGMFKSINSFSKFVRH